jgi:putative DNA primase/helicase
MLGNGMGKGRATNLGLARKAVVWRVVFISTRETSLEQVMAEAGKRTRAGQEVRFIEVPADTGAYGLFENLQGFENGAAFSSHLKETCEQLYGTAAS